MEHGKSVCGPEICELADIECIALRILVLYVY